MLRHYWKLNRPSKLIPKFHLSPSLLEEALKYWFKQCARSSISICLSAISFTSSLGHWNYYMRSHWWPPIHLQTWMYLKPLFFPLGNFILSHDFTYIHSSIIVLYIFCKLKSLAIAFVVISILNLSNAFGHFNVCLMLNIILIKYIYKRRISQID